MKVRKNLLHIIIPLLVSANIVGVAMASSTTLSVEPPSIINEALGIGSMFTVDIVVTDVLDLMGYEFKLGYDTTLLDATDATVGDFFSSYFEWKREINDPEGYVAFIITLPLGAVEGVDGSGTLATISFQVTEIGECVLDLYEIMLTDSNAVEIPHEALDGYFKNTPPVPMASFTWSPESPVAGETVTFDASTSTPDGGTIVSYAWNFGDGTPIVTVSNPITTHVYETEGTYIVTLTVTDSDELTDEATATITVSPPPVYLANLVKRSAWPEHHHHDVSRHGVINVLYGKVANLGDTSVKVKVVFTIYDTRGGTQIGTPLETVEYTLAVEEEHVLTADFDPYEYGYIDVKATYYVESRCWYDSDGDDVIDAPGAKIKGFGFAVVS